VDVDFVILLVIFSFFEGHAMYLTGKIRGSRKLFKDGFEEVLQKAGSMTLSVPQGQRQAILDTIAESIYEKARCGLFHDGMIRHPVVMYIITPRKWTTS
jgi:hypothetical protein